MARRHGKAALAVIVLALASVLRAGDPSQVLGLWSGTVDLGSIQYRCAFEISKDAKDALTAKIFTPDFSIGNPPVEKVTFEDGTLRLEQPFRGVVVDGKLSADGRELAGTWTQNGSSVPVTLQKVKALPKSKKIEREVEEVRGDPGEAVVTYHPIANSIGYKILHSGGNAFDAFVAATFAEYVLAPGTTTPAGPLNAMVYVAQDKKVYHLDATCNMPRDPAGNWDPKDPKGGAAFRVPGAVKGLEALSKRYGKLPFKDVLQPAIDLAQNGFPFDIHYLGIARWRKDVLARSDYGAKNLQSDNAYVGGVIRLPEMAKFLKGVAREGSAYVYQGDWAKACVEAVGKQGGHLSLEDLSSYKEQWLEPWKISYQGYELYASAGRTYGGLLSLEALQVLENSNIRKDKEHYTKSAKKLEMMMRVYQESKAALRPTWDNGFFKKTEKPDFEAGYLSDATTRAIWSRVKKGQGRSLGNSAGTHSYHLVVADKDGNVVTGTHTTSSLPWGEGIFVQGVHLNASGEQDFEATGPGERELAPFSAIVALKKGKVAFAFGTFNMSMLEASFQFLVNLVDYKFSAKDAVSYPRFGAQSWGGQGLSLDVGIDPKIAESLAKRGFKCTQEGGDWLDTGLGAVAIIHDDGSVEGAVAPTIKKGKTGAAPVPSFDYRRAEPGAKVAPISAYVKVDASLHLDKTFGDSAQGAKSSVKVDPEKIEFQFETGTGWGCGLSIAPPADADLRGYDFVQLKALAPKGVKFEIRISEAGVGDPSQKAFAGVRGSDGECYSFPPLTGTGQWETYKVQLASLQRMDSWGDQFGNRILDLQALAMLDLVVYGKQGEGKLLLKELEFRSQGK